MLKLARLKSFLTFLSELIRTYQNFEDGAFSPKLVNDILAVNYFCERTSLWKLDWVLNTSLILSSYVIWHAYRLIAETNIFGLGGSLICLLYVKEQ